ncbi:MAG: Bro-N domain-containing protein, partial [Bacteroidales bacterium]|nr:Bro-N domain-containing protein [Bacteroidales bacterium]
RKVRSVWDEEQEKWYFSVVDVVGVLTDQPDLEHSRNYWKVLKHRLKKEGAELVTNCNQLKLLASDGKRYKTDVADTEQMFRIIQSVPSPKAEPFKQWMARVAAERLDQMQDPELGIQRAMAELSATSITRAKDPQNFEENAQCASEGGEVARVAKEQLELKTGRGVVSSLSAKRFFEEQKRVDSGEDD